MAFEAIYHRYAIELLAIAMDKIRNRDIAEELVQETFIAFYNSKISLEKLSNIMAFLYVILKNKIMDTHRRSFVQRKYSEYFKNRFDEAEDNTQALIDTRELEQLLSEEIEKLPEQCRKVFNMRRKDFMSNKDIASSLQISENTVEQHMRRALRILKISFVKHGVLFIILLTKHFL
jgi:RNA polymerase sigma-70 factor (ECF subfamily)